MDEAYQLDIQKICHAIQLSGAAQRPEGERPIIIAEWLGKNIQTQRGRDFLAALARTPAEGKSALLRRTAADAVLPRCPLADTWAGTEGQ